jgi:hypothetical protein
VALQDLDILVGNPDPVGRQGLRSPETDRLEITRRRHLMIGPRRLHFVFGFGEVDDERDAVLTCQLRTGHERRAIVCIHRVRGHRGHDQSVVLEGFDECLRACQTFGRGLRVGDRELDDRLPEDAPQTGLAVAFAISSPK